MGMGADIMSCWESGAGRNRSRLGRPERQGRHHRNNKYLQVSTLGGCVLAYGSFFGGRSGKRTEGGTAGLSDPFWNVKHPEW